MRLVRMAALVGLLAITARAAWAAETLTVDLDQAKVTRLPAHVATIVVGNPLIADISLQAGGIMVVTGKGYGTTNVVALDHSGAVLMDKAVQVQGPQGHVLVMYRGFERETYSCTPRCERRITLGDASAFFDPTVAQTGTRNGLAQSSSSPPTVGTGRSTNAQGSSSASSASAAPVPAAPAAQ